MPINPDRMNRCLAKYFGFSSFRPGQQELIDAVLAGNDALGVLPTGSGKSLTYQLPAVLLSGLTIVVSPLIALIKAQVDAFNRRQSSRGKTGRGDPFQYVIRSGPGSDGAGFKRRSLLAVYRAGAF
jgi:superfamily II DNA or RNA helicase